MIAMMVLSWTFNFIVGKVALRHLDPLTLASFRVELAGVMMAVVYLVMPHRLATSIAGRPRENRFNRWDFWKFAQLGLLGVVMNQGFFTVGLSFTSVAHSALIVSMGPIYVLLLARAHGQETITGKKLLGMALCFCGVAVLAAEHGSSLAGSSWRGDVIMLSGSLGFAFYTVLGKKVAAQYDSLAMNLYNYLAAALFVLPVALWRGLRLEWRAVGWAGWAGLAYMALFPSVVAYLIYYWALRHMEASRLASFSSYLMPVLATVLGVVLLGERLTRYVVLGGTLVLAGLYVAARARRGGPPEREVAIVHS